MTDPITPHLADALREVVVCTKEWNEAIEAIIGRFPNTGIGLDRGKEALAAFDAAKDAPEDDALTAAYMAGSASRLDELRAKDAEIAALKATQPDLQPLHDLVFPGVLSPGPIEAPVRPVECMGCRFKISGSSFSRPH